MFYDLASWTAAVACGAILGRAVPRRDIAQAGGAFTLLVLSFKHQFGADLSRPTKMVIGTVLLLAIVALWRLTRPTRPKPTVA